MYDESPICQFGGLVENTNLREVDIPLCAGYHTHERNLQKEEPRKNFFQKIPRKAIENNKIPPLIEDYLHRLKEGEK